ncbi:MAG: DUF4149 domain-containing protein [Pseudomonadota bacterium]
MHDLAALIAMASLGGMLFFSAVVTPSLFHALNAEQAGRFLRFVFPRYFLVHGAMAAIAGVLALSASAFVAAGLMFAAACILFATRAFAVPIINASRDAMMAGDGQATARFNRWHGGSVAANLVEMAALAIAIYLLITA